jgi:hypothetical protein
VRAWLKDLPLGPKSQAHIRNLMSVLFNCAMLWDLIEVQDNADKSRGDAFHHWSKS